MDYFIIKDGQPSGPYTVNQMRSMWASGMITSATLYCHEGDESWAPLIQQSHVMEPDSQSERRSFALTKPKPMGWFAKICAAVGIFLFLGLILSATFDQSELSQTPKPVISISEEEITRMEYGSLAATGLIKNTMSSELNSVSIRYTLYDPSGASIGKATDFISEIAPGQVWRFKAVAFEDTTSRFVLDGVWCSHGKIH